jgi:hypothetical protein
MRDASAHFAVPLASVGMQRFSNDTAARSSSWLAGQASWGRRNHSLIHRSVLPVLLLACFSVAVGVAVRASAAEAPREVHGMADAFAATGVAIAWGVVRGASETATVAIRVVTDTALYPWVAVEGGDPFTQRQHPLLRSTSSAGLIDVRSPRTHFADFPRTELRFYDSAADARSGMPKLVVFYLGVPDTTPEFATEDKLDAYLTDRIGHLRGDGGSKTP